MLTLDLLYAVLQGLPPSQFADLDTPSRTFCDRVHSHLQSGHSPLDAMKTALAELGDSEAQLIFKALDDAQSMEQLSDLSLGQKQVLLALRSSEFASTTQLAWRLKQDRSNIRKRLAVLVKKGYVVRFLRPSSAVYFAVLSRNPHNLKISVNDLLNSLLKESTAGAAAIQPDLPHLPGLPK
jgi:predicted transcriptional regulator